MRSDDTTLRDLLAAIRVVAAEPSLDWSAPPTRLTGGFWADMWRFRLNTDHESLGGDMVARVMPFADVAARETSVQAHLARRGYPTPAVRLSSPPCAQLDRAWMLMDHHRGLPLLASMSGPAAIIRFPRLARALPDQLAHHAASLHAIEPSDLGDTLGADDLLSRIGEQAASIDRLDLASVGERLALTRPNSRRSVICHGDLHPFNILTHEMGDTVLDWSATRVTDPEYDIAFTRLLLRHPPLPTPRPLRPIIDAAGRALASRFTSRYNTIADEPVDNAQLDWFTDLQAFRIVTEVATWQAEEGLDEHPGHPFLALAPMLGERLRMSTTIDVEQPLGQP